MVLGALILTDCDHKQHRLPRTPGIFSKIPHNGAIPTTTTIMKSFLSSPAKEDSKTADMQKFYALHGMKWDGNDTINCNTCLPWTCNQLGGLFHQTSSIQTTLSANSVN
jgi:hypothetical protein